MASQILCIDDDLSCLRVLKAVLEDHGYHVITATDGATGLGFLRQHEFDAVIVDYNMPEMRGDEVAERVRAIAPNISVIMLSGNVEITEEIRRSVDAFISKGHMPAALVQCLQRLLKDELSR